jgi:hypothetical protein
MSYTPEQRAIAARLGDISRRFRERAEAQQQAQITTGRNVINVVAALTAAMDRSNELMPLFREYSDAFNELLVSIANGQQ